MPVIDNRTPYLDLPLPHPDNNLSVDVGRIVEALGDLDTKAQAVDAAVTGKLSPTSSLSAIGALTPAADRLPYFTGASTAALAVLSDWIRTNLLPASTSSAARSALGLAAVATSGSYSDLADKPTIPNNSDSLSEGAVNLYFSQARVRSSTLTGLSTSTSSNVVDSDSVLQALGKLQAQLTAHLQRLFPSGGTGGQVPIKVDGSDYNYVWGSPPSSLITNVVSLGTLNAGTTNVDLSTAHVFDGVVASGGGSLTLNFTNLPDTTNKMATWYIRLTNGAGKTITPTVAGKTWAWVQGVAPTYAGAGGYDMIMFYIMKGETKVHAMIVDTGTV